MNSTNYYINDTLNQLIDEAIDLKKMANTEFERGKLLGYYEIISRLLNQAEAFGISDKLPSKVRNFKVESLIDRTF